MFLLQGQVAFPDTNNRLVLDGPNPRGVLEDIEDGTSSAWGDITLRRVHHAPPCVCSALLAGVGRQAKPTYN